MKDMFYEQLVSKKPRVNPGLVRIAVIFSIIVLMTFGALFLGFFSVILAVVLGVAAYFYIFPHSNMEYEYYLLNYDMEIDAIYNHAKREPLQSFDIRKAEMIAPKGSSSLASFNPKKVYDYTSGRDHTTVYSIIINQDGTLCNILIEPDSEMLDLIQRWTGRHFSRN